MNGFSPVWILKCVFKFPSWLKPLLQIWHTNGRTPVCTRMWFLRCQARGKTFEQKEHWYFEIWNVCESAAAEEYAFCACIIFGEEVGEITAVIPKNEKNF